MLGALFDFIFAGLPSKVQLAIGVIFVLAVIAAIYWAT
jgi:hypothetical protein